MCLTHSRCRSGQRDPCVPGGDLLSIRIRRDYRSRFSSALVLYTLDEEKSTRYSSRSTSSGSNIEALRAGIQQAAQAIVASNALTPAKVARSDLCMKEESAHCPSRRSGKREAEDQAGRCQLQSMPDDHCGDIRRCCTDGHPHSNLLAAALSHRIRQNSAPTDVIFSPGMRSALEPTRPSKAGTPSTVPSLGHQAPASNSFGGERPL
jgi:hypothetical protein